MTVQGGVKLRLLADSGFASVVGARLYPVRPPDSVAEPYAYYRYANEIDANTLTGNDRRIMATFTLTVAAKRYEQAWTAANAARDSLADFIGSLGVLSPADTIDNVTILFESAVDEESPAVGMYEVVSEFSISFPF